MKFSLEYRDYEDGTEQIVIHNINTGEELDEFFQRNDDLEAVSHKGYRDRLRTEKYSMCGEGGDFLQSVLDAVADATNDGIYNTWSCLMRVCKDGHVCGFNKKARAEDKKRRSAFVFNL